MTVPMPHVLVLSLILFSIGSIGLLTRRDAITVFFSIEIILNAANVAFVGFARYFGTEIGHVAALIVIVLAAAEAAVGLGIMIRLSERRDSLNLDEIHDLKG